VYLNNTLILAMKTLGNNKIPTQTYNYIGLGLSSIFLMCGVLSNSDITFFLALGMFCGFAWSIITFVNLFSPNNFNLFSLGAASYTLFAYGGFLYAWAVSGMPTVMYYFSLWKYSLSEIDILWSCLYSNFFCIVFISFGRYTIINDIVSSSFNSIKNIKITVDDKKNNISEWAILISFSKLMLILTGQQKMSFLLSEEAITLGDQGTAIGIFFAGISPVSTFFIGILLTLPFLMNRRIHQNRVYIYVLCILLDMFFAFCLGRRPLLYHLFILVFAFSISLILNSTVEQRIKFKQNKYKIVLILFVSLIIIQLMFKFITSIRFLVEQNYQELGSFSFLDMMKYLLSQSSFFFSSGLSEISSGADENLSIRNAFTVAYTSHVIHGLMIFKKIAWGKIILSSLIVVLPSVGMFFDKTQNIQGEAQINDLISATIDDGANTLISYSLADLSIVGPFVYSFATICIVYFSFKLICLLFSNSNRIEKSTFISMWFAINCYFFFSMGESDIADLMVALRSLFLLVIFFKFVKMFTVKTSS
jgi:hypothetical protein